MVHAVVKKYLPPNDLVEKLVDEAFEGKDLNELLGYETLHPLIPQEGNIVNGKVIDIRNDSILVDFGHKSEGVLPYKEEGLDTDLDIGDSVNVLIKQIEEDETILLTRKDVELLLQQQAVIASLVVGQRVVGKLLERNKIGWVVDIQGLRATLPASQEYLLYTQDNVDSLLGSEIEAEVASIEDKIVILTREPFASEIRRQAKDYFFSNLQVGTILDGTVKNITDFGLFIQVANGVIGLCYASDKGPEGVRIGEQVKCKVLKIDRDKNRISLGIRQVNEPSWTDLVNKYNINDRVIGEVKSLVPYGAFLELDSGISGLVHISDLSWAEHIKHPRDVLQAGQKVEVVILGIDPEKEHLSLGLKQLTADPWEGITERYLIGSSVTGKISSRAKFGLFIELEKGIEGLAHHTVSSKSLKAGDSVTVSIIRIDTLTKRITLALD